MPRHLSTMLTTPHYVATDPILQWRLPYPALYLVRIPSVDPPSGYHNRLAAILVNIRFFSLASFVRMKAKAKLLDRNCGKTTVVCTRVAR